MKGGTRQPVETAGLTCARVVELPPYHNGAIFEKTVAAEYYST
jgi:hypothetical protein